MNDQRHEEGPPKKSIGELKKSKAFDEFLAETVAYELRQREPLDVDSLIREIKRRVNPGMHGLLDDEPDGRKD